ncbi:MAG: hypothetical protein IKA17_03415 [Clostridia bacterium]|nr:hypothetical protein [Clostridia bacterium]
MKKKISPKEFYESIYRELDSVTPLKVDCGKLCDNACCVVTDEITGMYLFPFEETMYSPIPEWGKIYDTDFVCKSGREINLFTCQGTCDREKRPLSCRIFPLIPRVEKDGSFTLVMDPRGREMCPLCKVMRVDELDADFVKTVEKVMKKCMLVKECRDFLCSLSEEIFF